MPSGGSSTALVAWGLPLRHRLHRPHGLTKLGARYDNPTLGRFTQTDPSGQETNRYAYVAANPITYSDPTGLGIDPWILAAGAIVGGIFTAGIGTFAVAAGAEAADAFAVGLGAGVAVGDATVNVVEDYQDGDPASFQDLGELFGNTGEGVN